MLTKENIQQAKERAENIQTATLKSNEKAIQETQKFYETLETCTDILNQIKENNNVLTSNQKILNDNINACNNEFKGMSKGIESATDKTNTIIENFKNALDNTSLDIKKAIHNEIGENIQAEINNVRDSIDSFNSEMAHNKTDINDIINTFKTELQNNRKQYKEQMEKETSRIITGNKVLFFFFIIFSIIPTLYCLNWQFAFIPFLNQIVLSDYFKGLITIPIAVVIIIVLIALIGKLFNKNR